MELNFTFISWILLATCLSSGGIAIYSHLKGYSNHQVYFTLLMLMIAEWSLMSTLESASITIQAKVFWSKLEYIGAMTTPVFFLRYAIGIAEIRNHWLTRMNSSWTRHNRRGGINYVNIETTRCGIRNSINCCIRDCMLTDWQICARS